MAAEISNKISTQRRGPVQARSQKRIEAALAAAEKLLMEMGPERTSIPEIAARADVPRATIYQYFPDKYALFAHMAESQHRRIGEAIGAAAAGAEDADWRALVRIAIDASAAFYNANAVAAILILMGPFGSADRAAQIAKDNALAKLFRVRLGLGDARADAIEIAIEIAFACLRWGYVRDRFISPTIRAEAVRATTAYLAPLFPAARRIGERRESDQSNG